MTALVFPASSSPGAQPGEGAGRIVNAYAVDEGFFPAPGLLSFATVGDGPRGGLLVGGTLYIATDGKLNAVSETGDSRVVGNLAGGELITMARNNRAPVPDVVIVTDTGAFTTDGSTVSAYPDIDIGSPNSVCFLDGYFLTTYGDGTIRASQLNSTEFLTTSYAKAEARPDGLLRGVAKGRQALFFGRESLEFWSNQGLSPFPLVRNEVIDVGLFGRWAVAGFEPGWDGPLLFVAADGTVRRLDGYTATTVSTRDVERAIAGVRLSETLSACVYGFGGNQVFSLSAPGFTWEYHLASGRWYERASYGLPRWRGRTSVRAFNRWLIGDTRSPSLMELFETARTEGDAPLVWSIEGLGPAQARLNDLRLYFSTGQGREESMDDQEVEPVVMVDWSIDGGARWSQPLERSLGRQGQYRREVRVASLGTARGQPIRVRVRSSAPVSTRFAGGEIVRVSPVR